MIVEDRILELEEAIRCALYGRLMDEHGNRYEGGLLNHVHIEKVKEDLLKTGVTKL